MCLEEKVHIVICGQTDGMLHAWVIDFRKKPCSVRKILDNRVHDGLVTTVTFLDESRIVSGGHDRAIVVTRIDIDGRTLTGVLERKLQLTLRCKGMRVEGLGGPDEYRKLTEMIVKAEARVQ